MSPATRHPGTTVYKDVDVDTFPARIETRGSRILGGLAVFIGAGFALAPVLGLGLAFREQGWSRDLAEGLAWFAVPFVLSLWLLVWGVNQWIQRLTILLDGHEVRWVRRSLRGTREEAEPLAGYEGVSRHDRFGSEDGQLYELFLQHSDPRKTVLLYRANRASGLVDRWRTFCGVFRMPPIEDLGPQERITRDVNDLGRSILDLIREGKVPVADPGQPPAEVDLTQEAGGSVVRIRRGRTLRADTHGLRTGSAGEALFPSDAIDAITIEPGRPPGPKPYLQMAYRHVYETDGRGPEISFLTMELAAGLPVPTLRWLQRYLLRSLAGV